MVRSWPGAAESHPDWTAKPTQKRQGPKVGEMEILQCNQKPGLSHARPINCRAFSSPRQPFTPGPLSFSQLERFNSQSWAFLLGDSGPEVRAHGTHSGIATDAGMERCWLCHKTLGHTRLESIYQVTTLLAGNLRRLWRKEGDVARIGSCVKSGSGFSQGHPPPGWGAYGSALEWVVSPSSTLSSQRPTLAGS